MDKVNIKIQVGNLKLPLVVDPDDEPVCRGAARMLNSLLEAYQTKYRAANLSQEHMLSCVAMDVATKLLNQQKITDLGPVEDMIKSLTCDLEDFNRNC